MSSWEKTVMNLNQLKEEEEKGLPDMISLMNITKAQAEISFKLGLAEGNKELYDIGVSDGKVEGLAEGIQEVVEFVESSMPETLSNYIGFWQKWQNQKKEWGL